MDAYRPGGLSISGSSWQPLKRRRFGDRQAVVQPGELTPELSISGTIWSAFRRRHYGDSQVRLSRRSYR
jgi:hypothetical protein